MDYLDSVKEFGLEELFEELSQDYQDRRINYI